MDGAHANYYCFARVRSQQATRRDWLMQQSNIMLITTLQVCASFSNVCTFLQHLFYDIVAFILFYFILFLRAALFQRLVSKRTTSVYSACSTESRCTTRNVLVELIKLEFHGTDTDTDFRDAPIEDTRTEVGEDVRVVDSPMEFKL